MPTHRAYKIHANPPGPAQRGPNRTAGAGPACVVIPQRPPGWAHSVLTHLPGPPLHPRPVRGTEPPPWPGEGLRPRGRRDITVRNTCRPTGHTKYMQIKVWAMVGVRRRDSAPGQRTRWLSGGARSAISRVLLGAQRTDLTWTRCVC